MKDTLAEIGFYTLEDYRAEHCSARSPLWRCELLVTDRCNFSCKYCMGLKPEQRGDLSWDEAQDIIDLWADEGLRNIRFSGGEPTLWHSLWRAVDYARMRSVRRIAISTNGSADFDLYDRLIGAGCNDFSISLDSCCAATGHKMAGRNGIWDRVTDNIRRIAELTYVTVGVVLTDDNIRETDKIIDLATDLGVSDIRLITAAQSRLSLADGAKYQHTQYPILNYRLNNMKRGRSVRGIVKTDNTQCPLVLDDMAVVRGYHYPCIIYLRQGGDPIGRTSGNMRDERLLWYRRTNTYENHICKDNCLDVCVDYNNRVRELQP